MREGKKVVGTFQMRGERETSWQRRREKEEKKLFVRRRWMRTKDHEEVSYHQRGAFSSFGDKKIEAW